VDENDHGTFRLVAALRELEDVFCVIDKNAAKPLKCILSGLGPCRGELVLIDLLSLCTR
jgi:hypothetical protein